MRQVKREGGGGDECEWTTVAGGGRRGEEETTTTRTTTEDDAGVQVAGRWDAGTLGRGGRGSARGGEALGASWLARQLCLERYYEGDVHDTRRRLCVDEAMPELGGLEERTWRRWSSRRTEEGGPLFGC